LKAISLSISHGNCKNPFLDLQEYDDPQITPEQNQGFVPLGAAISLYSKRSLSRALQLEGFRILNSSFTTFSNLHFL